MGTITLLIFGGMERFPKSLSQKLNERTADHALRTTGSVGGLVDFSSNDYLGLAASGQLFTAAHDYLVQHGTTQNGSTGSRLITGNHSLYDSAEIFIADFHEAESALVFNSGYDANVGFFSSVPQKGDVVLYDEYIHASIRDGLRMGNATAYKYAHNDLDALTALITRHREKAAEVYVVTESVFSMDGDSPELTALDAICKANNCHLVVDDAHTLGVFGQKGEGLLQHLGLHNEVFARIVTFGKGLGCHGAAVLGPAELKTYLINFARSFIYTTALPPHSLAAILSAYAMMQASAEMQKALLDIVHFFKQEVGRLGLTQFIDSDSAIQCAVIPGNAKVRSIAALLQKGGFSVKPILSPTVPAGQERLRFCLHAFNTREQVTQVLGLLTQALPFS